MYIGWAGSFLVSSEESQKNNLSIWAIFRPKVLAIKVASWFILKQKIPIWVNLRGLEVENVGIFYDHLEHFMAIWYNL
jgi:hypothetical protein